MKSNDELSKELAKAQQHIRELTEELDKEKALRFEAEQKEAAIRSLVMMYRYSGTESIKKR